MDGSEQLMEDKPFFPFCPRSTQAGLSPQITISSSGKDDNNDGGGDDSKSSADGFDTQATQPKGLSEVVDETWRERLP